MDTGILTLQLTFRPQTKIAGLGRHQIAMLVLGFPTILFGGSFMFYNKISHGAPHFTSWHGVHIFIYLGRILAEHYIRGLDSLRLSG